MLQSAFISTVNNWEAWRMQITCISSARTGWMWSYRKSGCRLSTHNSSVRKPCGINTSVFKVKITKHIPSSQVYLVQLQNFNNLSLSLSLSFTLNTKRKLWFIIVQVAGDDCCNDSCSRLSFTSNTKRRLIQNSPSGWTLQTRHRYHAIKPNSPSRSKAELTATWTQQYHPLFCIHSSTSSINHTEITPPAHLQSTTQRPHHLHTFNHTKTTPPAHLQSTTQRPHHLHTFN